VDGPAIPLDEGFHSGAVVSDPVLDLHPGARHPGAESAPTIRFALQQPKP